MPLIVPVYTYIVLVIILVCVYNYLARKAKQRSPNMSKKFSCLMNVFLQFNYVSFLTVFIKMNAGYIRISNSISCLVNEVFLHMSSSAAARAKKLRTPCCILS